MSRIDELKSEIATLEKHIAPLANELNEKKKQLAEAISSFSHGDVIVWDGNLRGRIIGINSTGTWLEIRVINIRKDGTDGSTRNVYGYQNPRRETVALGEAK